MKALPVVFSRRAERELDRIEEFIATDNPEAATRVRREIVAQAIRLGDFPEMGCVLRNPTRRHKKVRLWPVLKYRNYLILYRIGPEFLRVIAILNAAQDWTRFFFPPRGD